MSDQEQEEFFTRSKANKGRKVPLYNAAGDVTSHWLQILGMDSDTFRKAETEAKRKAIEIAQIEDDQKRAEAVRKTELHCIGSLVSNWSFDKKCTPSNVYKFLKEAPQIADMVNRYAASRSNFFKSELDSFIDGSETKSNSKEYQKAPKQPLESTSSKSTRQQEENPRN